MEIIFQFQSFYEFTTMNNKKEKLYIKKKFAFYYFTL